MTRYGRATAVSTLRASGALCLASLLSGSVSAQPPQPRFEAASIKPADPGGSPIADMALIQTQPGGGYRATNATLRDLVRRAFNVLDFQIVGNAPAWTRTDRFDIVARAAPGFAGGVPEINAMGRTMLVERFKVRAHEETRDQPIYALVLAREDGRLGPKLTVGNVDCVDFRERIKAGERPVAPSNGPPPCSSGMSTAGMQRGQGTTMADLARTLTPMLDRVVVDRTGLSASYDWELTFDPEVIGVMNRNMGLGTMFSPPANAPPSDRPPLMVALTEQLGLKLEGARGPAAVVVFDGAEHPTPD